MASTSNGRIGWAIIIGCIAVAIAGIALKDPDPAVGVAEGRPAGAASAAERDEDLRLYREALAEVEASAHQRGITVAQYAEQLGTTPDQMIGLTYAAKKTKAQAAAADRKIYGQ